jgi:hypothetical protein
MALLGLWLVAGACGIKGPPRPPLPEAPDGGVPEASFAPEAPVVEPGACDRDGGRAPCGEVVVLRFVATGRLPGGRLLLEEHRQPLGWEGPGQSERRILAVVSPRSSLIFRVPRAVGKLTYRLVNDRGVPWSPPVVAP